MPARFDDLSRYALQFKAVADQANRLALENAERLFGVQLRTLERNTQATAGFWGELTHPGAPQDLPSLLSKGEQVARDNFERVANAHQEIAGLSLKAGEALGELARQAFGTRAP